MKATDHFKNTIKVYLDQRAEIDLLFSFRYSLPEKKLDDCITYILNEVQKSGCVGFHDDEIFGIAVHFYDEDNSSINIRLNHSKIFVSFNAIRNLFVSSGSFSIFSLKSFASNFRLYFVE